jgi:hypothetical protein
VKRRSTARHRLVVLVADNGALQYTLWHLLNSPYAWRSGHALFALSRLDTRDVTADLPDPRGVFKLTRTPSGSAG